MLPQRPASHAPALPPATCFLLPASCFLHAACRRGLLLVLPQWLVIRVPSLLRFSNKVSLRLRPCVSRLCANCSFQADKNLVQTRFVAAATMHLPKPKNTLLDDLRLELYIQQLSTRTHHSTCLPKPRPSSWESPPRTASSAASGAPRLTASPSTPVATCCSTPVSDPTTALTALPAQTFESGT